MFCKCCKTERPDDQFLKLPRHKRVRVTYCNACAQRNMALWSRTALQRMTPDSIKELAE